MFALLGVALVLLPASARSGGADLQVVDLTGNFDRFAMSTAGMPDEQRVAAFERQIGPIADGFYSRERRPYRYDQRVIDNLNDYPGRRAEVLAVSRKFGDLFTPARYRFEARFGPVTSRQPIFLIDSMGEMDGGTRELKGQQTLLFGADVIAEIHAGKNLGPFFYHELFHIYREPLVEECADIRCSLWEEGLANYVASRLSPGAGDEELGLNAPKPIRPAVEADRSKAVCAVARRLNSTSDRDYAALFLADWHLSGFPSRMGYYIGYLVAQDVGRTHSLPQMARMSAAEAQPLIDASLARMATCPATTIAEVRERNRTHSSRG